MVDAARDAGVTFDDGRLRSRSLRRASPRPRLVERRQPEVRQPRLPRSAEDSLRRLSRSSTSTNCEVLAIVKDGVGVPAAAAGDAGRSRARPHQLLRRLRRPGRRHRLVLLHRRQHHHCRDHRLRSAGAGRARAQSHAQAADSPSATTSTPSSTATAATPSGAITPARTCCMPRCARCWARM